MKEVYRTKKIDVHKGDRNRDISDCMFWPSLSTGRILVINEPYLGKKLLCSEDNDSIENKYEVQIIIVSGYTSYIVFSMWLDLNEIEWSLAFTDNNFSNWAVLRVWYLGGLVFSIELDVLSINFNPRAPQVGIVRFFSKE